MALEREEEKVVTGDGAGDEGQGSKARWGGRGAEVAQKTTHLHFLLVPPTAASLRTPLGVFLLLTVQVAETGHRACLVIFTSMGSASALASQQAIPQTVLKKDPFSSAGPRSRRCQIYE
jgi:hypothetical protein